MLAIQRLISILIIFIMGLVFFSNPKVEINTNIEPIPVTAPVAWLEKRDEELEYWLQKQKKK